MNPAFDEALILKYDQPGPRYTSYPTAPFWRPEFGPGDFAAALHAARDSGDPAVSLYVHIPFCREMCSFCACNSIVTSRDSTKDHYLDALERELGMVREHLGGGKSVVQLHFGGGTPTFLSPSQLSRLMDMLYGAFTFAEGQESSVEVDPTVTSPEHLRVLRERGFSRISFGVQDFDATVQRAINRIQTIDETQALIEAARGLGYRSVNLDLVYGLPYQSEASFARTVQTVIDLGADRVAMYSYAHVPWLHPHQNKLPLEAMPGAREKVALFATAYGLFAAHGYVAIGMDHFARATEDLGLALAAGTIHRNFMGYTTRLSENLIGLGVSSISEVSGRFAQNFKKLKDYYARVEHGEFATERGMARSEGDERRRYVITRLMCQGRLDYGDYAARFGTAFVAEYAAELEKLVRFAGDGLLVMDDAGLQVTPGGRLVVRNICMIFDTYLGRNASQKPMFSRTV